MQPNIFRLRPKFLLLSYYTMDLQAQMENIFWQEIM